MHWLLEEETVNYSNLGPVKVHFDAEKGLGVNGESLAFTKTNSGSIQFLAENPGIYTLQKGGDQMKVIVNGFSDGFSYVNQSWSEPNLTASPLNQGTWSTIWSDKILLILLIVFIAVVIEWITFNLRKNKAPFPWLK